jgi:hypothetical protein
MIFFCRQRSCHSAAFTNRRHVLSNISKERRFLTIREAAKLYSLGPKALEYATRSRALPSVKAAGKVRIDMKVLEARYGR